MDVATQSWHLGATSGRGSPLHSLDVRPSDSRLVQFIENNVLGVRAALYSLAQDSGAPRFLLFPMIHIGGPDYYAQIRQKLEKCDVIVFEGVNTFRARVVTLSYRLLVHRRRLGRVVQSSSLLFSGLRERLIHADVASAEFNDNWARVPWRFRIAILILGPLYGAYLYLTASRESLGSKMKTEDLPSSDEVMSGDIAPGFDEATLASRDRKLVATIESLMTKPAPPSTVGIVYGAAHMMAVTAVLMEKYRYRIDGSDWLTVFAYSDV